MRAETGAQVLRFLEDGKRAYAVGDRAGARSAFEHVLELDSENEAALGYLSYLKRYDQDSAAEQQLAQAHAEERRRPQTARVLPPPSVSSEEILAEGRYRSGQQAEEAGDPYRAIRDYEEALRIDPKHAAARAQSDGAARASSRRGCRSSTSRASATSRTRISRRRSWSGAMRS